MKFADEYLQLVRDLPEVTFLEIRAAQLSEEDLKRIATLKQVTDLTISSLELSPAHLRPLQSMSKLVKLRLNSANRISPRTLDEFKKLDANDGIIIANELLVLMFLPELAISPEDSPETKLRKAKFNAALRAIQEIDGVIMEGRTEMTHVCPQSLIVARTLKESILDLEDKGVRGKLIDEFVKYTKQVEDIARERFESGARLNKGEYSLARYQHLDALLVQMQLQKRK